MATFIHGPAYPLMQSVHAMPAPGHRNIPARSELPHAPQPAPTEHKAPDLPEHRLQGTVEGRSFKIKAR
jgi:hypothetical protein